MSTTFVSSGVTSSGLTESGTGNILEVLNGGSAVSTTVVGGGLLRVDSGGSATSAVISSGGSALVLSGGAISANTVLANGVATVFSGGTATSTTVMTDGILQLGSQALSGQSASAGGSATGTIDSGWEAINSGGVDRGAMVLSGGGQGVFAGGLSISATVSGFSASEGYAVVVVSGGVASATTVGSGGLLDIEAGGTVVGEIILAGGQVNVGSGAAFTVSSGETLHDVFVKSGGVETIASGGVETAVGSNSYNGANGTVNVLAGGTLDHMAVASGGVLNVAGTTTSNVFVGRGSVENVLSGGSVSGSVSAGNDVQGTLNLSAGATGAFISVNGGGVLNLAGTTTNNVFVDSGSFATVSSGAAMNGSSGGGNGVAGTLNVLAGGSVVWLDVDSGGKVNLAGTMEHNQLILSGGVENVLSGGLITGAVSSGTRVLAGGTLNVLAGGSAAFVGVSSGGIFNVSGNVMSAVDVYSGGVENVYSGGVVTGVSGSGTAISGGTVNVSSGGALDHATAYGGGVLNVFAGATAHNITVSSGGALNVAGSITSSVLVVSGGIETVSSGGSLGALTTISGGEVKLQAGSTAAGGIVFAGSGGLLEIDGTTMPTATISSIALGEIDLAGVAFASGGSAILEPGNVLQVTESGVSYDLQLDQNPGVRFSVSKDSGTGTLITVLDTGPVETVANLTATHGQSFAASSLFTYSDPVGRAATQYDFWDRGDGGGHFVLNGTTLGANQDNIITAAQLSQLSYQSGSGADTLWVRANDGMVWGPWSNAFTVTAPVDTGPVETVANLTATHGQSFAGASLFTYSDPFGSAATQYDFWDRGDGGGHFVLNGTALGANQDNIITAAQLSQLSYQSGSGADTLWVRANDGTVWGPWSNAFTVTAPVDTGPVETVANLTATHGQSFAASSLFAYSDPFGSAATQYDVWDTGSGGGHFVLNGTTLGANQDNIITAAQLSQLSYQSGLGADTLWVRANDGTVWGAWSNAFTVTAPVDTGPVETVANLAATHGQSFAASSLFTYSDPFGSAATQYDVWDTGSGGGHFVLNGTTLGANQDNIITAAQLSQLSYQSGSGADTLWVRANDGMVWGSWSNAFTVTAPVDTGPVETVANLAATHGQSFAASSLFTYSDPFGSAATQYDFWDTGSGGGHFVLNGTTLGANQDNIITAAQLSQLSYQSGSGADTLWVRANDGTVWGPWSNAFTVTAPVDTGPVETVANLAATHGQSFAASSLFAYSDPFGSAATQYDVWDTGSGGGHFVLNGTTLGANQDNIITAAQLSQLSYQSGSGADTLWVRANDGTVWGAWSNAFTVTAPVDTGPVETVANLAATHGQSFAASSLFTYSDPFGSAATQYDVWDTGSGGGHFVLNGTTLGANQDNVITAAQLSQLSYQSGSGADTLWVRANDGTVWGAWSNAFTVTAPVDTGPVETVANLAATHGQSFAASSLFTYSDPFGSAATQYDFWDRGDGGGHFVLNGTTLGANQDNIITAAQLSRLSYQSGSGADTLWVRANDGTVWGPWSNAFTVTAPVDTGPVETPTSSAITSVQGQSFAASSLFTYSDPFGSAATQYDFWDTGGGGGHFVLNGTTLGANQDNIITAAQLSQLTYQVGSGTDTLWVRANDGTAWGAWSSSFTISDPSTIAAGSTLELPSAFSGDLSFAASTGTLQLDNSSSFSGTVAGMAGQDTLDLRDIDFGTTTKAAYSGNSSQGVLNISDGAHSVNIALLGNYMASTFATSGDGHGGTTIQVNSELIVALTQPQHA